MRKNSKDCESILALDLGRFTGWAMRDIESGQFTSGSWPLQGEGGERLSDFAHKMAKLLYRHKIKLIVYESVKRHKGTIAAHWYGAFKYRLLEIAENYGLDVVEAPVTAIKKHATGSGRADKLKMMVKYKEKWKKFPKDDNECDARWIAEWYVATTAHTEKA